MKIYKNINDFRNIEGGLDIETLEKILNQLFDFFLEQNVTWSDGIELINDIIYLKLHDNSVLSIKSSKLILEWINKNYDSSVFLGFSGVYDEHDYQAEKLVMLLDLTLDTLFHIRHYEATLPFINLKLKTSKNDFETFELNEFLDLVEIYAQTEELPLSNQLLDEVLNRADNYFKENFLNKNYSDLYCGLRETISEHKASYSISWCLKSEKYRSRIKRPKFVGSGALLISKNTELIQMAGSADIDWEEWFELEIDQAEIYHTIEIDYTKKKIAALKNLLECSTSKLLQLVNEYSKIVVDDEIYILEKLKIDLDKLGIENKIIKLRRKKNCL